MRLKNEIVDLIVTNHLHHSKHRKKDKELLSLRLSSFFIKIFYFNQTFITFNNIVIT